MRSALANRIWDRRTVNASADFRPFSRAGRSSPVRGRTKVRALFIRARYGPNRIRAELSTHGLGRDDIAAALDACERDWDASAADIIQRRYGNKDLGDPVQRRKAVDFLLRRGFEQKSAYAAARARPGELLSED